jgi:arginine N-succinyltransferase
VFYVRPIAREDLPALLALSERTGTGLTTLPANAERLAGRIERSLASFARQAAKADECYVFVLVDGPSGSVVGISAVEAAVGLSEPWYNYHVGTQVHASRELGVYTAAPTLFLTNDHMATASCARCSSTPFPREERPAHRHRAAVVHRRVGRLPARRDR